ncbi:MAG TPA: hypothetical protein VFC37_18470 [Terracidiphilus sp.]|nr:hypothetical protein [Terracidiphilus sp.]
MLRLKTLAESPVNMTGSHLRYLGLTRPSARRYRETHRYQSVAESPICFSGAFFFEGHIHYAVPPTTKLNLTDFETRYLNEDIDLEYVKYKAVA